MVDLNFMLTFGRSILHLHEHSISWALFRMGGGYLGCDVRMRWHNKTVLFLRVNSFVEAFINMVCGLGMGGMQMFICEMP